MTMTDISQHDFMEPVNEEPVEIKESKESKEIKEPGDSGIKESGDSEIKESGDSEIKELKESKEIKEPGVIKEPEDSETKSHSKLSGIKKVLGYLKSRKKRAVLKRTFRLWQRRPHKVAPLSESTHVCSSCDTNFQGNYCPRCGQSASVGRFSFKKAVMHFLDVWGMGNRSMFRTLRDLVFRPGYMIRDYLGGKQSAYFPPFKMFFIFMALSLIIEHGLGLDVNQSSQHNARSVTEVLEQKKVPASENPSFNANDDAKQAASKTDTKTNEKKKYKDSKMYKYGKNFAEVLFLLWDRNPAIFSLLILLVFYWPIYFFFRHSPCVPDLRFSEFVVAMVYTSNSYSIFSMLGSLFDSLIINFFAVFMIIVTISQFSGYKKWRVFWFLTLSLTISVVVLVLLALAGIGTLYLT